MNDQIAEQTIEDHKYLLELVENKCAIAFYAVTNRNQSLYNALKTYVKKVVRETDENGKFVVHENDLTKTSPKASRLESLFMKIIQEYDFMAIVMYPELKQRREFIHDCWIISKDTENDELKHAIAQDPFFYLTRDDLLNLLKTHDNKMITFILELGCMLNIREDIGYKLVSIKGA
jgi:hypothetical protein